MSTPPAPLPPATAADTRLAALQPILNLARPAVAELPIDAAPDAFARELQRQAVP